MPQTSSEHGIDKVEHVPYRVAIALSREKDMIGHYLHSVSGVMFYVFNDNITDYDSDREADHPEPAALLNSPQSISCAAILIEVA